MFSEPHQVDTPSASQLEVHNPTELLLVELSTRHVVLKPDDNELLPLSCFLLSLIESLAQNDYVLICRLSKSNGECIVLWSSSSCSPSSFFHLSLSPCLCGSDLNVSWRDNGISFVLLQPPLSFSRLDLQRLTLRIKTQVWMMVRHTLQHPSQKNNLTLFP